MMKRAFSGFICIIVFLLCTSCNRLQNTVRQKVSYDYFDTVSYIYSYAHDSNKVFEQHCSEILEILDKYHKLLDIYHEYSGLNNLCTVNSNAGRSPIKVERELIDFLIYARDIYYLTEGETDVSMGSVLSVWHRARTSEYPYLPSEEELCEASYHIGFDKLEIDENNCTVRLTDSKASLDPGAIGKGYATEKAAQYLIDKGITSYVLNIGGNIRAIGTKHDKKGWITGVRNPSNPDGPFVLKTEIKDCSCVTSGNYERYFTFNGKRYSHIIDKDTLQPPEYWGSVTVICKDSGLADSLSTCLFSMNYEEGRKLIETMGNIECIWVTTDGKVAYTEGILTEKD